MSRSTAVLAVVLVAGALAAAAGASVAAPAADARARDPIDHARGRAPDGTPLCAAWVHRRHFVRAGGRRLATWHPPFDRRFGCAYGHEHGSSPRAFRYFRRTRMPAFGRVAAFAGVAEPNAGFKVFVVNDDGRGLAWMAVLHQGSGSPRRGLVRHHSLELWLFRRRDGRLVAHTGHMADFGAAVPNCPGAPVAPSRRLLPDPACRSVYESWETALDVGGALRGQPGFAIDNPITQFDPGRPGRIVFNKRIACGPHPPGGWDSYCKGDRRMVLHPRWVVRNRGPARFRTDAYGRRAARGLLQVVSDRVDVDQSGECCGVDSIFVMERPSDGGIYRPGRGLRSAHFEHPGYCVLRTN